LHHFEAGQDLLRLLRPQNYLQESCEGIGVERFR
jgi:hypothetical protein